MCHHGIVRAPLVADTWVVRAGEISADSTRGLQGAIAALANLQQRTQVKFAAPAIQNMP